MNDNAMDQVLRSYARASEAPEADLQASLDAIFASPARTSRRYWARSTLQHSKAIVACIGAVIAFAVIVAVLQSGRGRGPNSGSSVTAEDVSLARSIAHRELVSLSPTSQSAGRHSWPSTLESVAVVIVDHDAANRYLAGPQPAGRIPHRVMVLRLVGSFSGVAVGGVPCSSSATCPTDTATAVTILADPRSGKVVDVVVNTQTPDPLPDAYYIYKR